ncbi:Maf family nucleotide pyrophosphatase [Methylonatrum kenyense]|uniref:Maf family protein n=1 Tax=Methylonatrum kenyense TaxID=455253 RepID=UPI0020BF5AE9|nr:Maf family nucleotide pyrophosphatase [Methylonatrum kenyense]MCK8516489.1 Maf family nucleotide pyrophosphatase [Methylonatrum kenyense]
MPRELTPPALVLASGSPHRKLLLQRFGLSFEQDSPNIDERQHAGETAIDYVRRLALGKAEAVACRYPGSVIIGSDQTACRGQRLIGKPGGHAQAVEQLLDASGATLQFHTAVCVLDARRQQHSLDVVTVAAEFRTIDRDTAERYLAAEPAYDCAGSFRSEGLGISLLSAMRGDDPTALVGLPLIRLGARLRALGYPVP